MEHLFLALLVIIMIGALASGFPVAFALPGSAIISIGLAAFFGYLFAGDSSAYFAVDGPKEWLTAGITNFRSNYWDVETDNLLILNRENKNYRFSVSAIIERGQNRAHVVKSGDVIKLERSKIIRDKVYVFGEVGSVESINVSQVNRPYLSEVLESARAFSVKEADIRHIYVLRRESLGKFNAFRFDVSNVLNFGLVEKLEMRPSDIVLVRTLPLYRFNRFINAVFGIGGNALGSIDAVVNKLESY